MRCNDCRFWSERLAQSIGGAPIEAYCLVEDGPFSGRYTQGTQGCDKGKSNEYGAIDDPYTPRAEIERLYAELDAVAAERGFMCGDCMREIKRGALHTCRQQIRRNQRAESQPK